MNVLSLCDGMSCGQIALKELGFSIQTYYASEIEKNAIKVVQDNFPETIQLGDVITLSENEDLLKTLPQIDLVMFGFPCRSLSVATSGRVAYNNGLNGVSGIFFHCLKILNWIKTYNNPSVKFLVENVKSNKTSDLETISSLLGVQPVLIDSNLFSAQDRERLYWTNIPIPPLPEGNNLVLRDILDDDVTETYYYQVPFVYHGEKKVCATLDLKGHDIIKRVNHPDFKSPTLTACRGGHHQKKVYINGRCRKLTETEYRKLQTIPDWFKMNVAKSHIYNMCGDGWTIEVIKHIFKGLSETK